MMKFAFFVIESSACFFSVNTSHMPIDAERQSDIGRDLYRLAYDHFRGLEAGKPSMN